MLNYKHLHKQSLCELILHNSFFQTANASTFSLRNTRIEPYLICVLKQKRDNPYSLERGLPHAFPVLQNKINTERKAKVSNTQHLPFGIRTNNSLYSHCISKDEYNELISYARKHRIKLEGRK